jgi:putative RecB family exonuclease
MPLPLPVSLSPSKVSSFTNCAMAFRFSAIDRVPEPPTIWAAKGTLVHRALELLYLEEPHLRTVELALTKLTEATPEILGGREYAELVIADEDMAAFNADAQRLVRNTFSLEDPTKIRPIGLELRMEASIHSLKLRGIIDRLELDENGGLIVTDYKTGKVPGERQEQGRLGGVQFYAFMVQQMLGVRPAKVQLMYLSEPVMIINEPTEQTLRGLTMRTAAVWKAVERACERDDFRPKPSGLCNYCSFKQWCPAFGGDPASAPSRRLTHLPADVEMIESAGLTVKAIRAHTADVAANFVPTTEAFEPVSLGPLDVTHNPAATSASDSAAISSSVQTPTGGPLNLSESIDDLLLDSEPVA